MKLYTIGFTGKTAEVFFNTLREAGVQKVIDVRLWTNTQLAGFSKSKDLAYFLSALCGIKYEHRPDLAPTPELLKDYKESKISWAEYEKIYLGLLNERNIKLTPDMSKACFLCAESTADKCHRRLLAEYLTLQDANTQIIHLPENKGLFD